MIDSRALEGRFHSAELSTSACEWRSILGDVASTQ